MISSRDWCFTFDDPLFNRSGVRSPRLSEVLENVLGGLGLACARLTTDNDRLVTFQHAHVAVRLVSCSATHTLPIIICIAKRGHADGQRVTK